MSRRKKSVIGLLVAIPILVVISVIVVSCSSKNKGEDVSSGRIALETFPHMGDMRAEHMDYIANLGSIPQSCSVCHTTKATDLNVNCAQACHTEVLSETRVAPLAAPSPIKTECEVCHREPTNPELGGAAKPFGHYPSEAFLCKTCHTADEQHFQIGPGQTTPTTNSTPDGCYRCHSKKDIEQNVHPALTLFAQDSCIKCHDPHGATRRYLTKGTTLANLCLTCHAGRVSLTGQSVHGVMTSGKECLNCHKPHSSDHTKLLKIESASLCLSCHGSGGGAPTPPAMIHTGITGDMCLNCHNPHSCPSSNSLLCPSP